MRNGWIEATLRDALEPIANRPDGKDYPLVLSVTEKRGIIPQTEIFKHRIATDDISKYKVLEPMDIAYNPYLLWCGAIGQWQGSEAGVVSPVYECFRVKSNCEPRYLGYIFETGILTNYFDALAIGSIVRRRRTIPSDFIAAPIQLPPLPEQKRIVDLISSVDSYIEALQQQLESAKRSRNAVLHELLTAGGDDWIESTLGDVAEWWSGGTPKAREPKYYENGTIPWAVIADMNKGIINLTNSYITKEALELIGGRLAPVGSVLISMYASVGKSAIANIPLATNQAIAWSIPNQKKIIPFYLYLVSQQLEKEISDLARGATQRNINRQMLREFTFQLPPLVEQERIVEIIKAIDRVIAETVLTTSKAKDLRSGLLSELLSGTHEILASYDKVMGAA